MIAPVIPSNEELRLRSVQRLGLLNTAAEERFDRLTRVAAALFGVPIALITLVDENRQWFKSCVGITATETGRDISFCGHAILKDEPFIIPDTHTDPRFCDNPLVTGEPKIRFYAGVPLKTDDAMLVGTICIIDVLPRIITTQQIDLLRDLAAMASEEMNSLGYQKLLEIVRKTQADFAGIFDHAAIGMALVSIDGRWLKTNKSLSNLLGYSAEELVATSPHAITHPEDRDVHVEPVKELVEGRADSAHFQKRYLHKNGQTLWADVNLSLLRDAAGHPLYFISQTEDITVRLKTQNELSWKSAFLEANISSSIDGIVVVDNQGKKILQNQRMVDLWTIPLEIASDPDGARQVDWCTALIKWPPGTQEDRSWLSLDPKESKQAEIQLTDGTYLEAYSSSVVGNDGVHYGRIFAFRDITARKMAEEELLRMHREYEHVMSAVEDGIHWIDIDGKIKYENPAAARMLGYEGSELIGRPAHVTMHHARSDGAPYPVGDCFIYKTLRDSEVRRVSNEVFWRKDGTCFDVEYTCTPIHYKGQPNGVVVTFIDATKRRKFEMEMQQARLAAESASQSKTDFLANMSHEIRTPLNGIIGMTDLISGTRLTAEQRDYLETIHASSENLLTIVNDVLDFSKIEFGKLELDYHAFSLLDLLDDVVGLLNFRVAKKKLDFLFSIEEGLPVEYLGDATRIRQVLINLVTNAIKFTEHGEISITVARGEKSAGDSTSVRHLLFQVRDTGIGIPADRLDRLFKIFSQVDASTTRRYGGSGLGLAICQKLVEIMGGTIRVDSQPGVGSTFSFDLPLESGVVQGSLDAGAPLLAGKHLLIVDDNAINRRMLSLQVARWNLTWRETCNPQEALEILQSGEHFDGALLDFQMPETDGLMLARRIRQLRGRERLPLVLVSSQTGDVSINEIKAAGFSAVIAKPVRQNILRSTLQEILSPNAASAESAVSSSRKDSPLPIRILVVEDNVTNQKVARQILKRLGYESDLARNGLEAVRAAEAIAYDLIFMDVHMPEMDGLEATRQIRARKAATGRPMIIALTADVLKGEREICLTAGMDDYITKPVKLEGLDAILEKLRAEKKQRLL